MSHTAPPNVTLDCSDSPLAIVSSAASFWTTAVALAVAYYALYQTFATASEAYAAFCLDISLFQLQLTHIESDLGAPKNNGVQHEESGLRIIREAVYEGKRTYKKAAELVRGLDGTMGEAVKHRSFTWKRMRAGLIWWFSGKAQAQELTTEIRTHRSNLIFYERQLLRRQIYHVHHDVQNLQRDLATLLQSPRLAQVLSNDTSVSAPISALLGSEPT